MSAMSLGNVFAALARSTDADMEQRTKKTCLGTFNSPLALEREKYLQRMGRIQHRRQEAGRAIEARDVSEVQ